MASTTTYLVEGMSCQHCVAAVTEEVAAIDGVTDVSVDLDQGRVTVTADDGVDQPAVAAAVDEAGYTLVGPAT